MNVTIYINGKRVAKEELSKYEIKNESVKRMLTQAMKRKNETEIKER